MPPSSPAKSAQIWPFDALNIRYEDFELRLPSHEELEGLAALASRGVHDPEFMPFTYPWTDQEPAAVARSVMQYFWATQGAITPEAWALSLTFFKSGEVIGTGELNAKDFTILRTIETGSWIGREFQGKGFGTVMRGMLVAFGFKYLNAAQLTSAAIEQNAPSNAISAKMGYRENGYELVTSRGKADRLIRYVLTRETWDSLEPRLRPEIVVSGVEGCLPLLGAPAE